MAINLNEGGETTLGVITRACQVVGKQSQFGCFVKTTEERVRVERCGSARERAILTVHRWL